MHAGMSEGPTGFTASSSYEKHFHFVLALFISLNDMNTVLSK